MPNLSHHTGILSINAGEQTQVLTLARQALDHKTESYPGPLSFLAYGNEDRTWAVACKAAIPPPPPP